MFSSSVEIRAIRVQGALLPLLLSLRRRRSFVSVTRSTSWRKLWQMSVEVRDVCSDGYDATARWVLAQASGDPIEGQVNWLHCDSPQAGGAWQNGILRIHHRGTRTKLFRRGQVLLTERMNAGRAQPGSADAKGEPGVTEASP